MALYPITNLSCTTQGTSSIKLNWTNNLSYDFIWVTRSLTPGGETSIKSISYCSTWTDTGLSDGIKYYYKVYGYKSSVNQGASNEAYAVTGLAAPSNLDGYAESVSQVNLDWNVNSTNHTNVEVWMDGSLLTTLGKVTSYNKTGLQEGSTHSFKVWVKNSLTTSPFSNIISVTLMQRPAAPSDPYAWPISTSVNRFIWKDNSNNEQGFKIYGSDFMTSGFAQIGTTGPGVIFFDETGLASNKLRYYYAKAYNAGGTSASSGTVSSTTMADIARPTNPHLVILSDTEADFCFDDNSALEDDHRVELAPGSIDIQNPVTNGEFEDWDSDTEPTHFLSYYEGTSSVNKESSDKHSGFHCLRLDIDASNNPAYVIEFINLTANSDYILSIWYKTAAGKTAIIGLYKPGITYLKSDGTWQAGAVAITLPAATTETQFNLAFQSPDYPYNLNLFLYLGRSSAASSSIYMDDLAIKPNLTYSEIATLAPNQDAVRLTELGGGSSESQAYTDLGVNTWTCPTGVTSALVKIWAPGGGGGGGGAGGPGGGAGGGAYSEKTVTVVPGTGYTAFNGTRGTGAVGNTDGNTATDSYFIGVATVLAKGGVKGLGYGNGGTGGAGGAAASGVGDVKHSGGGGSNKGSTTGGGGGGGAGTSNDGTTATTQTGGAGGATDGGAGGDGGNLGAVGNPGNTCGGGGGGGGKTATENGGNGAAGKIVISWSSNPYTNFSVRVRARQGAQYSDYSDEVSGTLLNVPAQVTGLTLSEVQDDRFRASWTKIAGVTGYKIETSPDDDEWTEIGVVWGDDILDYLVRDLDPSTQYFVRVRAYNGAGPGEYSDEADTTTLAEYSPSLLERYLRKPKSVLVYPLEISARRVFSGFTLTAGKTYTYEVAILDINRGIKIIGLKANGESYDLEESIEDVEATASSFYHDYLGGKLYVHMLAGDDPIEYRVIGEFTLWFTSFKSSLYPSTLSYNSNNYLALFSAADVPAIQQAITSIFAGSLQRCSGQIQIKNMRFKDGYYWDKRHARYIFKNCKLQTYIGGPNFTYAQFEPWAAGLINKASWSERYETFDFRDARQGLNRTIPLGLFSIDDYPLADENILLQRKPFFLGTFPGGSYFIPPCVDATNRRYHCHDGRMKWDGHVYKNDEELTEDMDYYVDYERGRISLARNFELLDSDVLKVTFTGQVNSADESYENGAEQYRYIQHEMLGLAHSELNLDSIYYAKSQKTQVLCIGLTAETNSDDVVRGIEISMQCLSFQDSRSRIGLRVPDSAAPANALLIRDFAIIPDSVVTETPESASQIIVNYAQDYSQDNVWQKITLDRAVDVLDNRAPDNLSAYNTYLRIAADAQVCAQAISDWLDRPPIVFSTSQIMYNKEPGDIVLLTRDRFPNETGSANAVRVLIQSLTKTPGSRAVDVAGVVVPE